MSEENLLRKTFVAAGTVALAFGVAGVAYAQTPAPSIQATASVSPSKAGTKSKPKSEKLKLSVTNNRDSKTTAAKITITMPSTLKASTSGLDICKASDDELIANTNVCKKSIAGKGSAHALVNPFAATPAQVEFKVVPVVGNKQILFVLTSPIAQAVPYKCYSCGYWIRLADSLGQAFGVCANEMAPGEAHVVAYDYGCGAHSDATIDITEPPTPDHAFDTTGYDTLELEN